MGEAKIKVLFVIFQFGLFFNIKVQSQNYHVVSIGFYNLENLFDTIDDPNTNDDEFTPEGKKHWTLDKYEDKLSNLSTVISDLGKDLSPDGVAILGVSEIENLKVVEDLIHSPELIHRHYKIIHYDSPDERGIDVAFIYQEKYVKILGSWPIFVPLQLPDGTIKKTRDILLVKSSIEGQIIYFTVNHWPSRRGGVAYSKPFRMITAQINKHLADSLLLLEPSASFITMGDLNDNPDDASLQEGLVAVKDTNNMPLHSLYNPFYKNYLAGEGSLTFENSWNLFDQIIFSPNLLKSNHTSGSYYFLKNKIYHKPFMFEIKGHYKNNPRRTFSGDNYNFGFSDHFPVLVYLVKQI